MVKKSPTPHRAHNTNWRAGRAVFLNEKREFSTGCTAEMITIRFAGWISGRIVSLQQDKDFQKLLSNGNRIRNRISETILSIFRGFGL